MAKGIWHYVGARDDLLHLAAWYYGDMAAWTHIYYANEDLYGDDVEMIPAGSQVFIPDVDAGAVDMVLKGISLPSSLSAPIPGPGGPPFTVRQGPKNTSFEIVTTDDGYNQLLFHFSDGSDALTGPGGVEYAAERLAVEAETISNNRGGGGETAVEAKDKGVPRSTARRRPRPAVNDVLRRAVVQQYGHHYMHADVLAANDLDEDAIITAGQTVTLPTRFKRGPTVTATKWRKRVGRR